LLTAQSQVDASYKTKLATALGVQATAQAKLTADQATLAKDVKLTTDTQTVSWPIQADQFSTPTPYQIDPNVLSKWASSGADTAQFTVYLTLYREAADGTWSQPPQPANSDVSVGVPVRLARIGRLLACVGKPCLSTLSPGWQPGPKSGITYFDQPVLQIGQMYNVPVVGGAFKSEGAVVALDPATGVPTSIETYEKTAEAAAIAGAAQNTANQAIALPAQISAYTLAAIQAQTNIATAKSAQITANDNLAVQGRVSALAAQTALSQADTAQINAAVAQTNAQANAP